MEPKYPTLPDNNHIQEKWPTIYEQIKKAIKDKHDCIEDYTRFVLKNELGADNIKNVTEYRDFFKKALKFFILLDADKKSRGLQYSRTRYGQAGPKGRIKKPDWEID